jgi:hypothetical protein
MAVKHLNLKGKISHTNFLFSAQYRNYWELTKGQLISKCPYEKSVSSKIPTKICLEFCPEIFCSFLGAS